MASLESEPATPRSVRSEQRHKSEVRLHQVKKNSLKSSNSDASSFDPSNLFGDLDIKEVFMRSVDGQSLWAQMEQNKTVKNFFGHKTLTTQTDDQNKEMIARTKLFVRILGYTLMEVEKRICRLISAAERREFMDIVVAAVPYPIHLETFANSTSKGLLDMFIRNKRHYQARKYGISLSSAPKANKK
uniref:Uncharacterized protein n=1 Tax=Ditylenchus dipsaci TaxID=166011 RepID=A0A915D6R5_9BILA